MNSEFIFKILDIPYDKNEIKDFYENAPLESNRFSMMDVNNVLKQLPSIHKSFNNIGLTVRSAAYISIPANSSQIIHRDSGAFSLAINFPVYNCQTNVTNFYHIDDTEVLVGYTIGTNLPYEYYGNESTKRLIESLSLTQPTLLNIKKPHQVVNTTDEPRVSISFRFHRDPWELAE